jgi:DNA-binding beta-propeller fold protein YncE
VNGTTINNIDRLGPATTVDPLSGIKVDGTPTGIVVNPSTNRLYAVNLTTIGNTISKIYKFTTC